MGPGHETSLLAACSNSWNFGNIHFDDAFYHWSSHPNLNIYSSISDITRMVIDIQQSEKVTD